jgi:hypothetical protein
MTRMLGLLAALLAILLWTFGGTIIQLENYRYANSQGLCDDASVNYATDAQARAQRDQCLFKTSTRPNPVSHLLYALRIW